MPCFLMLPPPYVRRTFFTEGLDVLSNFVHGGFAEDEFGGVFEGEVEHGGLILQLEILEGNFEFGLVGGLELFEK